MLDGCCGPTLTFPTCPECQTLYMPRSSPRLLAAVLSLLVLAPAAATTAPSGPLRADKLDKSVGITAEILLGAYHYASETGRSDLHARTLTQYIDALDPYHSVFLAADVARFTAANEGLRAPPWTWRSMCSARSSCGCASGWTSLRPRSGQSRLHVG